MAVTPKGQLLDGLRFASMRVSRADVNIGVDAGLEAPTLHRTYGDDPELGERGLPVGFQNGVLDVTQAMSEHQRVHGKSGLTIGGPQPEGVKDPSLLKVELLLPEDYEVQLWLFTSMGRVAVSGKDTDTPLRISRGFEVTSMLGDIVVTDVQAAGSVILDTHGDQGVKREGTITIERLAAQGQVNATTRDGAMRISGGSSAAYWILRSRNGSITTEGKIAGEVDARASGGRDKVLLSRGTTPADSRDGV